MSGSFIWTLTSVDIASGWTELRAIWNRGQYASFEGLESIFKSQPLKLLGVDSDKLSEEHRKQLEEQLLYLNPFDLKA